MLKDSLYTLSNPVPLGAEQYISKYLVEVILNTDHAIFGGHFPGQPVLPGVCMLEMVKDIIVKATGKPYYLSEARSIKYVKPVDPTVDKALKIDISTQVIDAGLATTAHAYLSSGEGNFKFRGVFSFAE